MPAAGTAETEKKTPPTGNEEDRPKKSIRKDGKGSVTCRPIPQRLKRIPAQGQGRDAQGPDNDIEER